MVGNLSFLTPVFCELQEVRKGKERIQGLGGGKVFLSPTGKKTHVGSSLRERGKSCPWAAK